MSWLAAVTLADAVGLGDPASRSALRGALAGAPQEAELILRLAKIEAATGSWEQALALSERAIRLGAVYDEGNVLVFSDALAHVGRCDEATFVWNVVRRLERSGNPLIDAVRTDLASFCRRPRTR